MLHRSPRALLYWALAAAAAVGTGAFVAGDLASLHRRAGDLGPELGAVVARHDLPVGATVTPGDVEVRDVHRSQLPPGALTSAPTALGRVVATPVLRGGFVADRNLAPRNRTGVDGALPAGTRAFHLVVTDALRPRTGSSVDVLATATQLDDGRASGATASAGSAPAALPDGAAGGAARVVAAGVLVLGTDDAGRTGDGNATLGVTLLVTPRQAGELAEAAALGSVTLALVPPEDAHVPVNRRAR
jgi:Flp pilus assembly protein CpaB